MVIADDHGLTLSALADSLQVHGLAVVGRAAGAGEAITEVTAHEPDALVIDLDLGPGPSGLHVAVNLRRRFPALGVVVLSGYADPRLFASTLPEPPRGTVYLVKQHLAEVGVVVGAVHDAIARARTGERASIPRIDLTRAQVQMLSLVAAGHTNAAIAEMLHITEPSVAKSINRIARRLGVPSDAGTNTRAALTSHYFQLVVNSRRP